MNKEFENISLKELAEIENLSSRTYNICKYNQLLDLEKILFFFYENKNFKKLRSCGYKSNLELINICDKYKLLHIQSQKPLIENKDGEKTLIKGIDNLIIAQKSIIDKLIFAKFNKLTSRSINALNIYLENNITLSNLNKFIFSNTHFNLSALKGIGTMSNGEINIFLNESKELLKSISGINNENGLNKEILKALLSKHFLVDLKTLLDIGNNYDFSNGIPIFKTIHCLIERNYIFNSNEKIIFNHSLEFFLDRMPESHNVTSKRIGLTGERTRQIRKRIFDNFNHYFSFIVSFEREKLNFYNLDTSSKFLNVGQSFLDKLLKYESVQFNVIFVNRILSILFKDIYSSIGNVEKIVLSKLHRTLHNWKTTYLISNHICSIFNFESMVNDVSSRLSERIKKDYNFHFQTYLLNFQRENCFENIDDITKISKQILYNEFEIKIKVNIEFKRNTRKFLTEHIYDVLKQSDKPLNIYEIFDILNQQFPGISKNPNAIKGGCIRNPDIIPLGSNIYGLKSWGKKFENIKGGTMHDIAEAFLLKYDLPKHIDDINKYVNKYRKNILSKNLLSNLKSARHKRFLFFKDGFVGLTLKTYKNNIYTKLPKLHINKRTWEESYNLLKGFTDQYKRLPKSSGNDYERKLYMFIIDKRCFDETKKGLIQKLVSKYSLKKNKDVVIGK